EVSVSAPFDRALEARMLAVAAEAYAARRGAPGSRAYRRPWRQFRGQVRTVGDLEEWRLRSIQRQRAVRTLKASVTQAQRIGATPKATAQLVDSRTGHLRLVAQVGFAQV